ncbi:MAG: peptidylprolyl isomerase [Pseudomonadota bacterium]
MKRLLLCTLLATHLTGPVMAQEAKTPTDAPAKPDPMRTLVTVNGTALPALYGNFIRQNRANRNAPPEAMTDEAIRDQLVSVELLAQEALRKELDKKPLVAATLDYQRKELLGQAAIEDFAKTHPIAEDAIRKEYDAAKAKAGENEYRPRHILVPTEKEAKDLIAKLTTGKKAKFEELAKKHSKDSSAGNGGDLGWTVPANLVTEFAEALNKMKKGEISKTPVKTEFGWHVILVEDLRKLDFPAYDKLRGRIASQMQQQQVRKYVQELTATAKVE